MSTETKPTHKRFRVVTGPARDIHSHHGTRESAVAAKQQYLGAGHELAQIEFTHQPVEDGNATWLPDADTGEAQG